ncbi:MAG: HNH endonuclease [Chitinophagaceae bacterium]|nr:MAG: HNH endonuclease [Chitinophagaceae bacterium]
MNEKVIDKTLFRQSVKWPNYGCSKNGRVIRWDFEKEMKVGMLRGDIEGSYPCVRVCHNNKPSWAAIHVMLAECWIHNDDPENKVDVNHKDGDKRNYTLDNLEWSTKSQNQLHAIHSGLKGRGEQLYNSSLTDIQVHLVCQELQEGARAKDLADKYECSVDIIRKIKDGSTYFHIRSLYPMNHNYKKDFSESTVRWVCDQIIKGYADKTISEMSTNKDLVIIEVKRIRNKIRYRNITEEYF